MNFREHFPPLAHTIYLNTPANGLLPLPVMEWRRQQDLDFLNDSDGFRMNHKKRITATKTMIASVFDAETDEIAMVPNFSFGLNMVLEGLEKKQSVLLLQNDYPSVNWPVENRDFEIHYAKIDENLEQHIIDSIEKFNPRIFIFSLVQWLNGIKLNQTFIRKLKNTYPDLILIGDGTQYLNTEKFSFKDSGLDVLITSGYKWLTSGFGNGFLIIRKKVWNDIHPKTIGFNSAPNFGSNRTEVPYMNYFEPGHQDSLNYGSIEQSLIFTESLGFENCYRQIRDLSTKAKSLLSELGYLEDAVMKRENHSMIFNLKDKDNLAGKLKVSGISSSPRGGGIRIGFHYYNDENDLDRLIETIKK